MPVQGCQATLGLGRESRRSRKAALRALWGDPHPKHQEQTAATTPHASLFPSSYLERCTFQPERKQHWREGNGLKYGFGSKKQTDRSWPEAALQSRRVHNHVSCIQAGSRAAESQSPARAPQAWSIHPSLPAAAPKTEQPHQDSCRCQEMTWLESRAPPRRAGSFIQKAFLSSVRAPDSPLLWLHPGDSGWLEHTEIPA